MAWAIELISALVTQIENDSYLDTAAQLLDCGSEAYNILQSAGQVFAKGATESACEQLQHLLDTAYQGMSTSSQQSASVTFWRRVYTDASLLRSLAGVEMVIGSGADKSVAIESIASLDRAIIIAGALGEGRLDLIMGIIERIQTEFLSTQLPCEHILSKSSPSLASTLQTASKLVPCLPTFPSLSTFQTQFSQHPFILRGYAQDWPCLQNHSWSSTEYLHSVAGRGRIVPVEVGQDYRSDNWTQRLMSWDDFLEYLEPSNRPPLEVLYLAQHNLMMQFPALRTDIIIPDYVYACLPPPPTFPTYKPPGNEEQLVINVWLGPAGTISPAHTDPYFNFYVQVVGRKTVWLAPPDVSPFMYPYPPSTFSPAGQSHQTRNPAANTTSPSMSNTSCVDVFLEEDTMDRHHYPHFWEKVVPNATTAVLEPGDLLFFPPGWWHGMRSEETSFSVSMWF